MGQQQALVKSGQRILIERPYEQSNKKPPADAKSRSPKRPRPALWLVPVAASQLKSNIAF